MSDRSSAEPWSPSDSDAPDAPPSSERPLDLRALSIADVLGAWKVEGPLIHEPTGIARLDELTGGGPVYGSRWYIAGAPDAGKTALLVQVLHGYAVRGVAAGLLAVDEDAGDIVTRIAQRHGYMRIDCEIRDANTLTALEGALCSLPLRLYDGAWTIEAAAADLAAWAREAHDGRAVLGIDSLQTVACNAEGIARLNGRELSEVGAVTARTRAIRDAATGHRLIALATSELGRGSYKSRDPEQQTPTLAGGKWSGAIEYSARVLLGLRSVAGESDLIDLEIAKNKHGPRDEHVFLRIDRRSQTLTESSYVPPPEPTAADRDEKMRGKVVQDAVSVVRTLLEHPGIGLRELRGAMRAAGGAGHDRVDAALAALGAALVRGTGPRGARPMTLERDRLPEAIRRALEASS